MLHINPLLLASIPDIKPFFSYILVAEEYYLFTRSSYISMGTCILRIRKL